MAFRLHRSASTLLLHLLVWGLVVVLLIGQQPDYPGSRRIFQQIASRYHNRKEDFYCSLLQDGLKSN